jgi:dihydrofolate reductase
MGNKGTMIWSCKGDLKHFLEITKGKTLLMGYSTWLNMEKLKQHDRTFYVLTNQKGLKTHYQHVRFMNYKEAMDHILDIDYCIGGKQTLLLFAPSIFKINLSIIRDTQDGDCKFTAEEFMELATKVNRINYFNPDKI